MMQRGFSLVELSIVLVILGLLTGGILAGQSLIRAAEIRSVSAEYARYSAAVNSFRDKYFALPGDMTNATKFWGDNNGQCPDAATANGTPGTCNGDGNGTLSVAAAGANSTSEIFQFWNQLASAGLVEGSYTGLSGAGGAYETNLPTNAPRSKLSNAGWTVYNAGTNAVTIASITFFEGNYQNFFFFGSPLGGSQTWGEALKPEEAWNIDIKSDDGRPGLGAVRAREDQTNCTDVSASAAIAQASSANYNLDDNALRCGLILNI